MRRENTTAPRPRCGAARLQELQLGSDITRRRTTGELEALATAAGELARV